ncbi:MAG: AraC family transcriptional regulator [Moraxellaceae bacterium]|nr:AraC family transcriptional regulator [Moraxellaceae bacterium]
MVVLLTKRKIAVFRVSDMTTMMRITALVMMFSAVAGAQAGEAVSREQIKGLDEQVQDIKSDVLAISTELMQLEEKLIHPSGTQVSLFLAVAKDHKVRLDAVDVRIDGVDATHHLYTHKELEALQSGGVQRLYTGNLRSGEHVLEVTLTGKTAGNAAWRESATWRFTKEEGPRLVELTLADGAGSDAIRFKAL